MLYSCLQEPSSRNSEINFYALRRRMKAKHRRKKKKLKLWVEKRKIIPSCFFSVPFTGFLLSTSLSSTLNNFKWDFFLFFYLLVCNSVLWAYFCVVECWLLFIKRRTKVKANFGIFSTDGIHKKVKVVSLSPSNSRLQQTNERATFDVFIKSQSL